ncbi:hypothetical protein C8Q70DRAFT_932245 [Cubamyces menziesii]|nr:hypothetical protein C8Q70DRAFT_932245 [Cubamyces menziesii]
MIFYPLLLSFVLSGLSLALAAPLDGRASGSQPHPEQVNHANALTASQSKTAPKHTPPAAPNCFPALGFTKPQTLPADNTNWWCDPATEYAFVGFSYEVTACQSREQLIQEFSDIRNHFNSRYVRLYGFCDREGFYDDIVEAAWENTLGIHALIWFGFDGSDIWISRRDTLLAALHANPKAKYVTRVLQFGSEPLFDNVLPHATLAAQVLAAKQNLSSLHIPVTVSELAYGYQERGGAQDVLDAIDSINIHMLPFFSQQASTSDQAWPLVENDLNWFIAHGNGKKIVQPNSPLAVADIPNEQGYYTLLDEHCEDLKAVVGGGIGWFAHIYSDNQEPGYGIYNSAMQLKFPFAPRTEC